MSTTAEILIHSSYIDTFTLAARIVLLENYLESCVNIVTRFLSEWLNAGKHEYQSTGGKYAAETKRSDAPPNVVFQRAPCLPSGVRIYALVSFFELFVKTTWY